MKSGPQSLEATYITLMQEMSIIAQAKMASSYPSIHKRLNSLHSKDKKSNPDVVALYFETLKK